MDHEQFLTMVAQIARTDRDTAERASQTLHPPLHRGRDADGLSRRMGPDEFTRRVARRAGLSLDEAARRIPAVFAVLRCSPCCARSSATSSSTSACSCRTSTARCWARPARLTEVTPSCCAFDGVDEPHDERAQSA